MKCLWNVIFCLIQALFVCFPLHSEGLPQKKIVVVVPSYNNAQIYKECLDSILGQKASYDNFSVIYIDDASTDDTGDLVAQYIKEYDHDNRIVLIRNEYNCKALANIYRAVHMCDDDDLIYIVDGDDALAHDSVLSHINDIYSTEDVWIAYARYKNVPEKLAHRLGVGVGAHPTPQKVIDNKSYRHAGWYWSGSRSFYAWLFKCIKLESLLNTRSYFKGKFYPLAYDWAMQMPMFELAGNRLRYIPEVLLLRHVDNPINDFKIAGNNRNEMVEDIKRLEKYPTLGSEEDKCNYLYRETVGQTADLIVCTSTDGSGLSAFLNECRGCIQGLGAVYVVIDEQDQLTENTNESSFMKSFSIKNLASKDELIKSVYNSNSKYFIVANENVKVPGCIDLKECIRDLEETFAHAFYFNIDLTNFGDMPENKLSCVRVRNNLYAWKYEVCNFELANSHSSSMTMYRKEQVLEFLRNSKDKLVTSLSKSKRDSAGLFLNQ